MLVYFKLKIWVPMFWVLGAVALLEAAPSFWCFSIFIQAKMSQFASVIYSNNWPKDTPRGKKILLLYNLLKCKNEGFVLSGKRSENNPGH